MKLIMFNFRCNDCSHEFEKLAKPDQFVECPLCGGKADKALSAPGGFNLVGAGFYQNDFKGKK